MRKVFLIFLLGCILLAGCGGEEEALPESPAGEGIVQEDVQPGQQGDQTQGTAPYEVSSGGTGSRLLVERDLAFDIAYEEEALEGCSCVGLQFYKGEPVMLMMKAYKPLSGKMIDGEFVPDGPAALYPDCGLYLLRMDGSMELLIPGESLVENLLLGDAEKYRRIFRHSYTWYVDDAGCCYCTSLPLWPGGGMEKECFLKLSQEGELLYRVSLEPGYEAEGFCNADGVMYVVLCGEAGGAGRKKLVEFDPDTGRLSEKDAVVLEEELAEERFGTGPEGIYLYDGGSGVSRVGLEDGGIMEVLSLEGSTFSELGRGLWDIRDFRVLEDGSVETLYLSLQENGVYGAVARGGVETLEWVDGGRTEVTLRASSCSGWLKGCAAEFNRQNSDYWVVLEEYGTSGSPDREEYARRTSVEMASGKGPVILCGDLMEDYIGGLIDKKALLELGEQMELSGMEKEDYLPSVFGSWKKGEAVYGINPCVKPAGIKVRRELLDDAAELDIYVLMESLSGRAEEAVYYERFPSGWILEMFLEGSESLWGMIDWDEGTCDFGGELFVQILENAKRYGYDGVEEFPRLARKLDFRSIYSYDSRVELELEGMAEGGVLFDDGCHGAVDGSCTLAVNAAYSGKEK